MSVVVAVSESALEKTLVTTVSRISDRPTGGQACLVVIYGMDLGKRYPLDDAQHPELVIGRSTGVDIRIDQEAVSRNHCKLLNTGEEVMIRDLGSTNGTYVNDRMVDEHVLTDGDLLKVGRCIFKFLAGDNIESAYHEEIYRLKTIDGLTQVFNKRHFLEQLESEMGRARRYRRDLSLIMYDIDRFKSINDTFGHLAGDYVLKKLAHAIQRKIRGEDKMARYGGEEFVILLPEIDRNGALMLGEKIRAIAERTHFYFDGADIPVTISVGVSTLRADMMDTQKLIQLADENLYTAKRNGRNRVAG